MFDIKKHKICVVGLGYVGLPVACAFSSKTKVYGFDISKEKVNLLKQNIDPSGEISSNVLKSIEIQYSFDPKIISKSNFIIIAVPTPIRNSKIPDFQYLESASKIVGENISKNSIVVFESTVYPGVTENICAPIIEKYSNFKCGQEFKIGYSPERINPGDTKNTIESIKKVVSGMDEESLEIIDSVYKSIITAGTYKAKSIKVAEACKVVENIQRDLNIALMNELTMIFDKLDINTIDVLEAAKTKWNFHPYKPGLVGGHCIGVDPYYLTFDAQSVGYNPLLILSARNINESMSKYCAEKIIKHLSKKDKPIYKCNIAILGLTYKENVADPRNSKAKDLILELKKYTNNIFGYDPLLESKLIKEEFGIISKDFSELSDIDCILVFSPHEKIKSIVIKDLKNICGTQKPLFFDVKSVYLKNKELLKNFNYLSL